MFFYLATEFDLDSTYLQMTLLRIILCWIGSLLACTALKAWVAVSAPEATQTLSPPNLCLKVAGSTLLVLSILQLKDML